MKTLHEKKFPVVFLACPFNNDMKKLLNLLKEMPWKIEAANSEIRNEQLLKKITADIKRVDISIFDISGWNPNVCLELGLAEGMKKLYYIINNTKYKNDAPSDIKGIERIDYNWNKKKNALSIEKQIIDGIFKRQFFSGMIWKSLQHQNNAEKKFKLALSILSQFKTTRKEIKQYEIKNLAKGLNLKKQSDFDELLECLTKLNLFKRTQGSGALKKAKNFYTK